MRVDMNLTWVAVAATVPLLLGLVAALPFWLRRVTDEMGSIAGAAVVLLFVIAFIAREYGEVELITARCIAAEVGCRFVPSPFTRFGIFGGIGMLQIFLIFAAGLSIEERLRRRAGG